MIFGNLFSADLLLLIPSFFLIITILLIIVYSVFTSKYLFSRFLVEDVLLKVSFSLFLFLLLLFNQISPS